MVGSRSGGGQGGGSGGPGVVWSRMVGVKSVMAMMS